MNFVTAHDGFTLQDLVSYNEKHNEANGEDNRDGSDHNLSWNCGAEGETHDPEVLALRARQVRNFLTTILCSQGVPMLLHGDEVARTQRGNNNVYCQDNELSWQPWQLTPAQRDMLAWTKRVIRLRKDHPVLRRRGFFRGRPIRGAGVRDITWLRPDGREMQDPDWSRRDLHCFGIYLAGAAADLYDDDGQPLVSDSLLIAFNNRDRAHDFRLTPPPGDQRWALVLDTARPEKEDGSEWFRGGRRFHMEPRSMAVFRHTTVAHPLTAENTTRNSAG